MWPLEDKTNRTFQMPEIPQGHRISLFQFDVSYTYPYTDKRNVRRNSSWALYGISLFQIDAYKRNIKSFCKRGMRYNYTKCFSSWCSHIYHSKNKSQTSNVLGVLSSEKAFWFLSSFELYNTFLSQATYSDSIYVYPPTHREGQGGIFTTHDIYGIHWEQPCMGWYRAGWQKKSR